jgi:hypothetical protein
MNNETTIEAFAIHLATSLSLLSQKLSLITEESPEEIFENIQAESREFLKGLTEEEYANMLQLIRADVEKLESIRKQNN